MGEHLRVILEIGPKRRVVAGAMDWPGLDRWGRSEEGALETLTSYLPRYADVARRAGLADTFERVAGAPRLEVVDRHPGSSTTDFWGIVHFPSPVEHDADLGRRARAAAGAAAGCVGVLRRRRGPRLGGAREGTEGRRKVARRDHPPRVRLRAPQLVAQGRAPRRRRARCWPRTSWRRIGRTTSTAFAPFHAEGKPARTWPLTFLIRRTAQHVMDHAWELEDKDLTSEGR